MDKPLNQQAQEALNTLMDDYGYKMPWIAEHTKINLSKVKAIRYNKSFQVSIQELEALQGLINNEDGLTKTEKRSFCKCRKKTLP
jgi:hypothetical protein